MAVLRTATVPYPLEYALLISVIILNDMKIKSVIIQLLSKHPYKLQMLIQIDEVPSVFRNLIKYYTRQEQEINFKFLMKIQFEMSVFFKKTSYS